MFFVICWFVGCSSEPKSAPEGPFECESLRIEADYGAHKVKHLSIHSVDGTAVNQTFDEQGRVVKNVLTSKEGVVTKVCRFVGEEEVCVKVKEAAEAVEERANNRLMALKVSGRSAVLSYDEQGRLTKVKQLDGEKPLSLTEYRYDEQGQKVEKRSSAFVDGEARAGSVVGYKYSNGKFVSETWVSRLGKRGKIVLKRHPNGTPMVERISLKSASTVRTFDEQGRLISQTVPVMSKGEPNKTLLWRYFDSGLLKDNVERHEDGKVLTITRNAVDEAGRITRHWRVKGTNQSTDGKNPPLGYDVHQRVDSSGRPEQQCVELHGERYQSAADWVDFAQISVGLLGSTGG